MKELCLRIGDPQKNLKFIHVAGSNGKGSTCAMIESVLRTAGYRTGLYISPYIQEFCERIQLGGRNIPEDRLADTVSRVRAAAGGMEDQPSWFEVLTAASFIYYMEENCDIVVLETGMGGRSDATNVIDPPEAAVITNIGLEHTEFLGDTPEEIAAVKSGIIKPGCSVIAYSSTPEISAVIADAASACGDKVVFSEPGDIRLTGRDIRGQSFVWEGSTQSGLEGEEYFIPLHGEHQLRNAAIVLETVAELRKRGWDIPDDAVREGLRSVRWPARFEILAEEPVVILDGGHNPQCTEALTASLQLLFPGQKADFILGVMAEKDHDQMLDLLAPYAARVYCVAPDSYRAMPPDKLAEDLRARGIDAYAYENENNGPGTGLRRALSAGLGSAADEGRLLVCYGSLYLAGEILNEFSGIYKKWLRKRKIQAREAIPEDERAKRSKDISLKLADMPEFRNADTIFIYNWTRGEVRLDELADIAAGQAKRIVYPKCVSSTEMAAVLPGAGEDAWTTGAYGIREPDPDAGTVVDPDEIDLVICPCTAFDEEGRRLGMGGGYYDRYLPFCTNADIIAAAYEVQKAGRIPVMQNDIAVNAIVTEKGIYSIVQSSSDY